jgi:hypothetical protein
VCSSDLYELASIGAASLTIDLLTDVPADDPRRRAKEKAAEGGDDA